MKTRILSRGPAWFRAIPVKHFAGALVGALLIGSAGSLAVAQGPRDFGDPESSKADRNEPLEDQARDRGRERDADRTTRGERRTEERSGPSGSQDESGAIGILAGASDREEGVRVLQVYQDSPAAAAGIRRGDIILEVDNRSTNSPRELSRAISRKETGETVAITLLRNGSQRSIQAKIESREEALPERRIARDRRGSETTPQRDGQRGSQRRQQAFLGVRLGETEEDQQGVKIDGVKDDGPASKAGLQENDILTAVDGQRVRSAEDVHEALDDARPGQSVRLTVLRDGDRRTLTAQLASASEFDSGRGQRRGSEREALYEGQEGETRFDGQGDMDSQAAELMLKQQRHLCEQHQRLEKQLREIRSELQALREAVGGGEKRASREGQSQRE